MKHITRILVILFATLLLTAAIFPALAQSTEDPLPVNTDTAPQVTAAPIEVVTVEATAEVTAVAPLVDAGALEAEVRDAVSTEVTPLFNKILAILVGVVVGAFVLLNKFTAVAIQAARNEVPEFLRPALQTSLESIADKMRTLDLLKFTQVDNRLLAVGADTITKAARGETNVTLDEIKQDAEAIKANAAKLFNRTDPEDAKG